MGVAVYIDNRGNHAAKNEGRKDMKAGIHHKWYTVGVGISVYADDRSPAPDITCGHRHRSTEAAEKCRDKLLGYHRDPAGGSMICSAKWYNSYILGLSDNGRYQKIN